MEGKPFSQLQDVAATAVPFLVGGWEGVGGIRKESCPTAYDVNCLHA